MLWSVCRQSLVSVRSVSGQSPASPWSVSGQSLVSVRPVSGQCPVSVWSVPSQCLVSVRSVSGQSLVSVRSMSGRCPASPRSVSGQTPVSTWSVSGQCPVSIWSVSGQYLVSVRSVSGQCPAHLVAFRARVGVVGGAGGAAVAVGVDGRRQLAALGVTLVPGQVLLQQLRADGGTSAPQTEPPDRQHTATTGTRPLTTNTTPY